MDKSVKAKDVAEIAVIELRKGIKTNIVFRDNKRLAAEE